MGVQDKYKVLLLSIIHDKLPSCHVYLFGSRARGTNYPGSDIDIALDTGSKINIRFIGDIKEAIEESSIPFFVDIVDFHAVSSEMREQIRKDGILWNI